MRKSHPLDYLEGRRFCIVFVKILDQSSGRVQCRCLRGRASIDEGQLKLCGPMGPVFSVPSTAWPTIAPNDGTAILKDAEYYCLIRVSDNIDLESHHCHCHDHDHGNGCDSDGDCDHGPIVY